MRQGCRRDEGFALVLVLWSVMLLALFATQLTAAGRTELRTVMVTAQLVGDEGGQFTRQATIRLPGTTGLPRILEWDQVPG